MAQRGYRPPRNTRNNSPIAVIAASILLIVVAAIVGWLIFGYNGAGSSTPTPGTATTTTVAVVTSPTASADPKSTATPEATATAAETPTQEATPVATPTEPPTPTPQPTPTPVVGDYGELPSADIPSGTPGARRLQLDYHLNLSLQSIPQQAPVYLLEPRTWKQADVEQLAKSLGVTGDVTDQGNGSFSASGGAGNLYISNSLVQYIAAPASSGTPTSETLPGNDALVQTARSWLIQQNLLGAAIGPGAVINRDEAQHLAQVQIKPVEPDQILSAIPSANVTLNAAGDVLEAYVRWPASMPRSTYGLRSSADLWSDASQGRGYVEIDDSSLPSGSGALSGQATITATSLAYTTAGAPETKQYLVPLVVFEGQATVDGVDNPIPIKIYVPAVGAQAAPRG